MIRLCPFCGWKLIQPLCCGITTCNHCNRLFNSSEYNQVLSAAWMVRRWHIDDYLYLQTKFDFPQEICSLVRYYVIDLGYSHDDLVRVLDKKISS